MKKPILLFLSTLLIIQLCSGCGVKEHNPTLIESTAPAQTDAVVRVPDLIGVDESSAKQILLSKGLIPVVEYEHNSSVREGDVIRISPDANLEIEKDSRVTLYVSLGTSYNSETPDSTAAPKETDNPSTITVNPSVKPDPTQIPSSSTTQKPKVTPTPAVTSTPTKKPTATSTPKPTATPTPMPTATPTPMPTATSTPMPTATPTPKPTATPTPKPTATPTPKPTATPTPMPTATPLPKPTATPSPMPTATPTPKPTATPSPTPFPTPEGDQVYVRIDDYIYFGSYPQSEVKDSNLKKSLTNIAGSTSSWQSYGYYIKGYKSNFMVYKDVTYDGQKYRGVYFSQYRPRDPQVGSSLDNSDQDDNGYRINTVYWFKYEPIKWKILSESGGSAYLCAVTILDAQSFHHTTEKTNGYYANNYARSDIRVWLNNTFYDTAFSSSEKNAIKNNISLLSYASVTNSLYGFVDNSSRAKYLTAYARAQGGNNTQHYWWLVSPVDSQGGEYVYIVANGSVYKSSWYCRVTYTHGVVPALNLTL